MKTERLYAVTLYLLNHGKTTATELARKFEVSIRTIQRDMDSLCRAGIPVLAETGAAGGYSLSPEFRMNAQTATREEYALIRTALRGLCSAVGSRELEAALEKISALSKDKELPMILDFSVLREKGGRLLEPLQAAIRERKFVRFTYTDAGGETGVRTVEPVAVVYRWYAWYLLAYSPEKGGYRTYKLLRMENVETTGGTFTREHAGAETILREESRKAPVERTEIRIRCRPGGKAKAVEYLNGVVIREDESGCCDMILNVVEREHFWFGALLSLGDEIEILEPERIRNRVLEAAEKIVCLYRKL